MREKTHKINYKLYLNYTLLFCVTAVFVFLVYIIFDKSFVWDGDGILQHYPILGKVRTLLSELFKEGSFSFWSWDIGLGADTLGNLAIYLFDPFAWFTAAFPAEYMIIGYNLAIILRFYVAGLVFLMFCRTRIKNEKLCLMGSLSYAFSPWSIGAIGHPFFLNPLILFPMIIFGIDKVEKKKSPYLLIFSVTMCFLTSLYFSYMTALMVLIYLVTKYANEKSEKSIGNFCLFIWKYIVYVLISLCLASMVLLPCLYTLIYASKESATTVSIFHSLRENLNYLSTLITNDEVFSNYSYIGMSGIFTITIPVMIHRIYNRKASTFMYLTIMLMLMNALPIFGSLFNGLSYPAGRWCYGLAFFFAFAGVEYIDENKEFTHGQVAIIGTFLLGLLVYTVVVCKLIFNLGSMQSLAMAGINVVFGIIALYILSKNTMCSSVSKKYGIILGLLVFNLIIIYNLKFSPNIGTHLDKLLYNGQPYQVLNDSPQKAGTSIEDTSFYRIDQVEGATITGGQFRQVHTPTNENLYFGNRTIYGYLSTLDSKWFEFNKVVGNNAGYYRRVCSSSNDNRTRLDFLLGVKYFIGDSAYKEDNSANQYAGYGFKHFTDISGTKILKTKYSVGLGFIYDNVIRQSEFEKYSYLEREQILMDYAVIADDEYENSFSENLRASVNKEYQVNELDFEIISSDGIDVGENTFKVNKANGTITIKFPTVKKSELYISFNNLKRIPFSYDELYDLKFGNAKEYASSTYEKYKFSKNYWYNKLKDNFVLSVYDDSKVKRAINSTNDNQGFSDIEDFIINFGYFDSYSKEITIRFSETGVYSYDQFKVQTVPIKGFISSAQSAIENKFTVEEHYSNYIKGTVNNEQEGLLYLSILKNDGWRVYIDGEKVNDVIVTNYAFTGIQVPEGEHVIELKYRPVGFYLGIGLTVVGILSIVVLAGKRRKISTQYKNTK